MYPEQFLYHLKISIKREWKICFGSTLLFGILAHIYKLTNFLPNWDSLLNLYADQDKTSLGRCFLTYACSISSYYDLPWVNGLLSIFYLSGTAVCICELFHIRKRIPLIFIGGLLGTFPTVTSTLAYGYTADGYFLALLCVCIAVLFAVRGLKGILPAAVLLTFSLGIYQAYLTFALVLMLMYLIDRLLFDGMKLRQFGRYVLEFLCCILLGCIFYWLALKALLWGTQTDLSEYQNISAAASFQNIRVIYGILRGGFRFLKYFFDFSNGVSLFLVLNILLCLLLAVLFLLAFWKQKTYQEPWRLAAVLFSMLLIPIAS